MAYPESGATYRNEPAWLDRVKRAEGGPTDADMVSARAKLTDAMRRDAADRAVDDDALPIIERDRDEATQDAYRRGDYDSTGTYRPFRPVRGE